MSINKLRLKKLSKALGISNKIFTMDEDNDLIDDLNDKKQKEKMQNNLDKI